MGSGQSYEKQYKTERQTMFILNMMIKQNPRIIQRNVFFAWRTYVKVKEVRSIFELVPATDYVVDQVYYYIDQLESNYVIYKEHLSDTTLIFQMCNQETFEQHPNNSMQFDEESDGKVFRLIPRKDTDDMETKEYKALQML